MRFIFISFCSLKDFNENTTKSHSLVRSDEQVHLPHRYIHSYIHSIHSNTYCIWSTFLVFYIFTFYSFFLGLLHWSYKMNIKCLLKIFVKQHTRTTLSRSSLHRRISDTGGGEEVSTGREGLTSRRGCQHVAVTLHKQRG